MCIRDRGEPIEMDDELFEKQLEMLEKACTSEAKDIKQIVASVVKTYHPDLELSLIHILLLC